MRPTGLERSVDMRSERTGFLGVDGQRIDARIDVPDADIRAYALFAHSSCGMPPSRT